jgi:hypothetical protein
MLKKTILILLMTATPALAQEKDSKILDNAIVTKLAASFEFATEPGLYEVISKKTGNTVFLYIDRNGNVQITAVDTNVK